jgi:hypothetical protein
VQATHVWLSSIKTPSTQDKHLVGASLYPQEGFELIASFPDKNLSPIGWFLLSKVIMQSAQANHIMTFENKAIPKIYNSVPHIWKQLYSLVWGPATPFRRHFMTGKQIRIFGNYRLASHGDLVPFRSFKLNVNKNKAVVYVQIWKTSHNMLINWSRQQTSHPSEITKKDHSVHREL